MQKCKQCEWEFPEEMQVCPYCGRPVEREDEKQKRRFELRRQHYLPGGVKQLVPAPRPVPQSSSAPPKKHIPLTILAVVIIVAMLLTGVLLVRANQGETSLTANPSSLDFGPVKAGSTSVLSVVILKSSESRLRWQIAPENVHWLQIAPKPKTHLSGALEDIYDVTADTSKLKPETYKASLLFSSDKGMTLNVPVSIHVINSVPPAKMSVSPLQLDFGSLKSGDQKTMQVTVSNSGGRELNWIADAGKTPWLVLDHYSGKVAAGAPPQTVNVTVDTTTLTTDQYAATINLSANGATIQVAVKMKVTSSPIITTSPSITPPCLNVTPSSLTFVGAFNQNDAPSKTVTISNCGSAVDTWSAVTSTGNNENWLHVDPHGDSLGGGATGTATITTSNLAAQLPVGTYAGMVTFTMGSASMAVQITLTVDNLCFRATSQNASPGPGYTSSLSMLSPLHALDVVWLYNCGNIDGTWSGTPKNDWLHILQDHGSLNSGAQTSVIISANDSNLLPGIYTGSITFTLTTSAGTISAPVQETLTVPAPTLIASPSDLMTGGTCVYDPVLHTYTCKVTLTNSSSDGLLDWNATSTFNSVTFSPKSYPLSPSASVTVTIANLPICAGANGSVSFNGPANNVVQQWSCGPG